MKFVAQVEADQPHVRTLEDIKQAVINSLNHWGRQNEGTRTDPRPGDRGKIYAYGGVVVGNWEITE